jgi:ABC-2 type transport system permease protein
MTATDSLPGPVRAARAPLVPMLLQEVKASGLQVLRVPAVLVAGIVFPVILFLFLGLMHRGSTFAGLPGDEYVLAAFATFATTNVMLLAFGLGLSLERSLGIDVLIRASPVPVAVRLAGQTAVAMATALVSLAVLLALGVAVTRPGIAAGTLLLLVVAQIAGAVPFAAMGMALGYSSDPRAANAVLNLVYLLLGFLSGILVPISELPGLVRPLAPFLPTYRHAELSWTVLGGDTDPLGVTIAWLAGYAVVFFTLAARAYRREQVRKFA